MKTSYDSSVFSEALTPPTMSLGLPKCPSISPSHWASTTLEFRLKQRKDLTTCHNRGAKLSLDYRMYQRLGPEGEPRVRSQFLIDFVGIVPSDLATFLLVQHLSGGEAVHHD